MVLGVILAISLCDLNAENYTSRYQQWPKDGATTIKKTNKIGCGRLHFNLFWVVIWTVLK